jgi:DNA-binding MarR family transcriptional regulator
MFEPVILAGIMVTLTFVVALLYSKRIREAHERYLEAKGALDDIILSFNRQLKRQEDDLEGSKNRLNRLSRHGERLAQAVNGQKRELEAFKKSVVKSGADAQETLTRLSGLEDRLNQVVSGRDEILQKITNLEKRQHRHKKKEPKIETAIPIKREKALAPLTETELTVLEYLAAEGEKTAPQIKEQIKLSREHTARLMKKLYEKGYLERSASKVPFTYRLKEEMRKLLKKPEQTS